MCGIVGFVDDRGGVSADAIAPMLRSQLHRGPDASGHFQGRRATIGQTRLSIIDLARGDPPLLNEDGSIAAVLNGEIYNHQALQEGLLSDGHVLSSRCDTEVLAHLAESLEPVELCGRVDGMFACAVWDERKERLVLARDRFGKKPLHYWHGDGTFVFGSEIKAVLAHPRVRRELNEDALGPYLVWGYVPTPSTFFRGIYSLPPGHVLTYEPGGDPVVRPFWRLPVVPAAETSDAPLAVSAGRVRQLLLEAVERRLVADVPVGAFLSGGIDSATVVALMAQLVEGPVPTFSIGFDDDEGFDERPFSRLVAQRYGTDHHEFVVRPDAAGLIERLTWHHDQPFGDSSAIPTYLLAEKTRSQVTVALSGDGGDEVFAGYGRFPTMLYLHRYRNLPSLLRRPLEVAIGSMPRRPEGRVAAAARFAARSRLGPPEALASLVTYSPDQVSGSLVRSNGRGAFSAYVERWEESDAAPLLHRLLHLNARTYLLDDLLPKVDRMSMAHGLEVRCPFLDPRLWSYVAGLPPHALVRRFETKRVLRHAVEDLLPQAILGRSKRGFSLPLRRWFRYDLRGFVEARLGADSSRVRRHVDGAALDAVVGAHVSGRRDYGDLLWALLTLEVFLEREDW